MHGRIWRLRPARKAYARCNFAHDNVRILLNQPNFPGMRNGFIRMFK